MEKDYSRSQMENTSKVHGKKESLSKAKLGKTLKVVSMKEIGKIKSLMVKVS